MTNLPWTPDFDYWPVNATATSLSHESDVLRINWSDQSVTEHHALLLRENSPDPGTIHPKAREMCISPTDIDSDLKIISAGIADNGAISVSFSDGTQSEFHPGWLKGTGWHQESKSPQYSSWRHKDLSEPPTFHGPDVLTDQSLFLNWLEALNKYGVARLQHLPQQDGLLEKIVTQIGPVRETNFGRQYTLVIKDDPDSQAYTSDMLLQHIDLPTRETPCGLQFLYTRENTAKGGEGIYADGYKIAEDLRAEEPEHYLSLTQDIWQYNNRAKNSDYRASGPVVETNINGDITGIRYNTFLRAPLNAPTRIQARAYKAYRAFCARAQNPHYWLTIRYQPGDLFSFDNRRVLHGRKGYEAKGGERFIEGIYSDRDDLYSRIRTLKRQINQGEQK